MNVSLGQGENPSVTRSIYFSFKAALEIARWYLPDYLMPTEYPTRNDSDAPPCSKWRVIECSEFFPACKHSGKPRLPCFLRRDEGDFAFVGCFAHDHVRCSPLSLVLSL